MSKFFGFLFSAAMTSALGYLTFESNQIIENLVQVLFWIIIIVSYPVYALVFVGVVIGKDEEQKKKTVDSIRYGVVRKCITGAFSIANIVFMSMAGFFWLPIFYALTCLVVIFVRAMIISSVDK